ncbi:NACHT domain-containing NTPase [Anabaena cylindrica UHCC 0172]|uniref:NACHT domain-containing protein n=1 Tax=Anabaena cylindrica TaxID=1165 RepID=UPI002B1F7706|nr:NACHT domain-containing NTPase [Anabaena cylindrica]MEA5554423.1 NACHT domain-containing NTPase [Anabaena cylindrica UHCC 0172]
MQLLPREFLTKIARKYDLSPEQEEAFVERFSRNNEDELQIAETLHISSNAFRTRLTGVYQKFSISGKGPGKFRKLHDFLSQEYQKTNPSQSPDISLQENDIDTLVQEVRTKIKPLIQERCGTMRVLDMTQPIGLNDIYTSVNILETITGRQRLKIEDLFQQCTEEDFDRFGMGKISIKRVPGLDAVQKYPKLMILGKPGAGKTTFLKYLAIQCIEGVFHSHLIPIFITLKNFAEADNKPSLLEFISTEWLSRYFSSQDVEKLLTQGRMLILLDGLDEVREEDGERILKEISNFSRNFQRNQFVMTCRIAAKEYTFEKFTEVEVADFDNEQIATFATNWFKNKPVKSENFIKHIKENKPIQELASSPLLLTLLCLAFEESGDFPANRSELYKEGLDALLKKWDAKRGIQREQIYKKLSVQRKEDLLSTIALTTFEQSDYFFKQKAAEQYIIEYIRNLPDANNDPEALQLDSEKILKSIEAQHGLLVERAKGIYSFSHLTFHEYFTAREFVLVQQSSDDALQSLVSHFIEKRWREVCLLAVGMSPNADRLLLLIKDKIDVLVSKDEKLQQLLQWVKNKSLSVQVSYKPVAVRAFYFGLSGYLSANRFIDDFHFSGYPDDFDLDLSLNLDLALNLFHSLHFNLSRSLSSNLDIDIALSEYLFISGYLYSCRYLSINLLFNIYRSLSIDLPLIDLSLDPKLNDSLQKLKVQIPDRDKDEEAYINWWQTNGKNWIEELRNVMIKYRNIGHNWQFSEKQEELLQQCHYANQLLVDCLNSDCYVSRDVRQYIEDTLLLPIAEIKPYTR